MYLNSSYCSDIEYVRSNLGKNQVIEYVDVPQDKLPQPIYEDDAKRYWEIWKKTRGYKLYSLSSLSFCLPSILSGENNVPENFVRLYRAVNKAIGPAKPILKVRAATVEKVIVP